MHFAWVMLCILHVLWIVFCYAFACYYFYMFWMCYGLLYVCILHVISYAFCMCYGFLLFFTIVLPSQLDLWFINVLFGMFWYFLIYSNTAATVIMILCNQQLQLPPYVQGSLHSCTTNLTSIQTICLQQSKPILRWNI